MISAERWARIKDIVGNALELNDAERAEYVERECANDSALRHEVESLLMASDGVDSDDLAKVRGAIGEALADHDATHRALLADALGEQYEILKPLGRGGMGDVYLARERALDRLVAIKVLRPDLAVARQAQERFRREARIVAQLTHPAILRLHTFGEVRGLWYFVMGYVRGASLAERLRLEGTLSPTETHRIVSDVADALEYAHEHGVVHRDIKPANILLDDETGHPVIADFGISKVTDASQSLTQTGAIVGTPDYMAPEQVTGDGVVDHRTDIYSLGAVAYRALTGREPFGGATTSEVIYRRVSQDPVPLAQVAPTVSAEMASVIMKCLARNPADRWQSARALRDALRNASGEADVPEGARELPTFAPYALLWAIAWTAIALLTQRSPGERALLLLIASLVPIGLALHIWNGGRHGASRAQLARVACWPPEWWGMWWPRALRRPADVWSRLPWQAKVTRGVVSLFFVAVPTLIVLRQWLASTGRLQWVDPSDTRFIAVELAALGVALVLGAAMVWWASRQGLRAQDSFTLLFGPTSASTAWRTPGIERLLGPAGSRVRPPATNDARDHHRAIRDALPLLPTTAADTGSAVMTLAERILAAIQEHDRELASLERMTNLDEVQRLTEHLASLSEPSPSESSDRRDLREGVRKQLDAVRRLRDRRETLAQARARLFDMLRGLWTQVRPLCERASGDAEAVSHDAERVRALCTELTTRLQS